MVWNCGIGKTKTIHAPLTEQPWGEENFSSADLCSTGKILKQIRKANTSDYYSKIELN